MNVIANIASAASEKNQRDRRAICSETGFREAV
jgi:hypothetical protein